MPRKKLRYLCRATHPGRTIAGPHPDPNETAEFPVYSPAERQADLVVHIVGLALGLAGCAGLAAAILLRPDAGPRLTVALGLYGVGLMAMLAGSALYNLTDEAALACKRLFRRLDHAAIFLMIAGTYTPFALVAIGGALGTGLLAFVWAVAVAGIAAELLSLRRHDGLAVATYLLLGWSILPALEPVSTTLSASGVALLAAGGVLYSVGAGFHLWRSLPFQNPIWHGFVLAAAACHYTAVLREVAAA